MSSDRFAFSNSCREYWRYEIGREGALKIKRPRQFV
jgi:hypothetical protein